MSEEEAARPDRTDCWNRIGVWGGELPRCEKLAEVIHCSNCEVYLAAGRRFYSRVPSADYIAEWTRVLGEVKVEATAGRTAVMVFRVDRERFALPVRSIREVLSPCPVHSIPHRTGAFLRGLAFVQGELQLCVNIDAILELPPVKTRDEKHFLFLGTGEDRWVCPVTAVEGIAPVDLTALEQAPVTVRKSHAAFVTGLFRLDENPVSLLDPEAVLRGFRERMS